MKPEIKIKLANISIVALTGIAIYLVFEFISAREFTLSLILTELLFVFPIFVLIHYTIKIRSVAQCNLIRDTIDDYGDFEFNFSYSTVISKSEFNQIALILFLKNVGIVLVVYSGILFIYFSLIQPLVSVKICPIGIFMILIPVFGFLKTNKIYISNPILSQEIKYNFNKFTIEIVTTDLSKDISWENIHKITEFKSWYLLQTSKYLIVPILIKKSYLDIETDRKIREVFFYQKSIIKDLRLKGK